MHFPKLLQISYSCLSMPKTVYVKMSLKERKITAREKKKEREGDRNDILAMKNVTKKKYVFAWHK